MNLTELRVRAERAIAEGQSILSADLDEPRSLELAHLIEELRIYQAELELQNEELNQAQDQLAQAKERYRRLFNDLPVPALVIDGTGFVVEANNQACLALGLSTQVSLRHGAFARFFMPADADRVSMRLRTLDESILPSHLESMHLKADGGVACYDVHLMPLLSQDDGDGDILVVFIDRSAEEGLKTLSAELEQAKLLAEQANSAKSAFLANIGHELRTPLNALMGLSRLLLESREPLSSRQEDYLAKINAAAEALANMINEILDEARLAEGKPKLEAIALSIEDLLTNTRRLFSPIADDKGLRFECLVDPRIPDLLVGDPLRIQQVLNHLVDNALKFTERGGVRVWIERWNAMTANPAPEMGTRRLLPALGDGSTMLSTSTEQPGIRSVCWLRFTVSDTGRGLSPEQQAQLWASRPQADPLANPIPTEAGLGLAISRHVVELMGGQMGVESQVGQGSVFWFEIPLGLPGTASYPVAEVSQAVLADESDVRGTSVQPLDPDAIQIRLKTLACLLDQHLSRARVVSAEIEQSVHGTSLQDNYAPIARMIQRLDFETALQALQHLAKDRGWTLS
ncbi:ATP-binding protein [Caldichromatium japonicum]|nr:ATP-binding protein [Caldichromatium japonicum]